MVVDDQESTRGAGELTEAARQEHELAPREELLAELKDVRAATQGGRSQVRDAVGLLVRSDHVEAGGEEPL